MMREKRFFLLCSSVLWLATCSTFLPVSAGKSGAHKHGKYGESDKHDGHPSNPDHYGSYHPHSRVFNVMSFGAVGDGVSDDYKALTAAWKAACAVPGATIEIPSKFKFLIRPITLQGPCMPHLVLQIDGILLAPSDMAAWSKNTLFQWINLKWVHDFIIQGSGTLDGQGSAWWNLYQTPHNQKETKYLLSKIRPTVLRFYKSSNVTVRGIRIINSPQCHLKFDSSWGVKVKNITISSPQDSPNTDGVHLQDTRDVEIKHSNIGCGDDCVSIQTGSSNIYLHHMNCSPSHGISLGGLGKGNSLACVSNVTADSITVQNAQFAVRIKTWQGGIGSVRNVTFSNVQVSDVEIPIVIDQYYCNKRSCKNKTDTVEISGVMYKGIKGTYTVQPLHLACSDSSPCTSVHLFNVQLSPASESRTLSEAFCWNCYGQSQGPLEPSSVGCLQRTGKLIKALSKSHNYTC